MSTSNPTGIISHLPSSAILTGLSSGDIGFNGATGSGISVRPPWRGVGTGPTPTTASTITTTGNNITSGIIGGSNLNINSGITLTSAIGLTGPYLLNNTTSNNTGLSIVSPSSTPATSLPTGPVTYLSNNSLCQQNSEYKQKILAKYGEASAKNYELLSSLLDDKKEAFTYTTEILHIKSAKNRQEFWNRLYNYKNLFYFNLICSADSNKPINNKAYNHLIWTMKADYSIYKIPCDMNIYVAFSFLGHEVLNIYDDQLFFANISRKIMKYVLMSKEDAEKVIRDNIGDEKKKTIDCRLIFGYAIIHKLDNYIKELKSDEDLFTEIPELNELIVEGMVKVKDVEKLVKDFKNIINKYHKTNL